MNENCTFSNPQTYNGGTPSSGADFWQYSTMQCSVTPAPTSTPSAVTIASPAAYIDIASSSAIAKGVYDITFILWVIGWIIAITCGFWFGQWLYKR